MYNNNHLISGTLKRTISRLLRNSMSLLGIIVVASFVPFHVASWLTWIVYAITTLVISSLIILTVNFIFEKELFTAVLIRGVNIVRKNT